MLLQTIFKLLSLNRLLKKLCEKTVSNLLTYTSNSQAKDKYNDVENGKKIFQASPSTV